ncbi:MULTISPECIES: DUF7006 family protein [Enterococcus]|uniref:DUF7006 family protein n=1 Tax=Enterococcus TaxID=1350 RepID=UPI0037F39F75
MRHLLAVDAQIQILIEYLRWDFLEVYSEKEVIQQIKEDSSYYYREKTGLHSSTTISLSILYLRNQLSFIIEA